LSLDRIATMEEIISNTLVRPKFFSTLLGAFAGVAVLLALTGIYGVLSFMVRQRSREIGIRMSLGATRRESFSSSSARARCSRPRESRSD
jgi:ABC-type antimicrobial peptide transport system permease subunit